MQVILNGGTTFSAFLSLSFFFFFFGCTGSSLFLCGLSLFAESGCYSSLGYTGVSLHPLLAGCRAQVLGTRGV